MKASKQIRDLLDEYQHPTPTDGQDYKENFEKAGKNRYIVNFNVKLVKRAYIKKVDKAWLDALKMMIREHFKALLFEVDSIDVETEELPF